MAESVLSKLVQTDKDTKKTLESIDSTLDKIYRAQIKEDKRKATADRKAQQAARRSKGDVTFAKVFGVKKSDEKKAKKSFFQSILDGIGNLFKGITGLTGPMLLKALGIAGLGAAITAYFKSEKFRSFMNDNILKPLGNAIKDQVVPWLGSVLNDIRKAIARQMATGAQPQTTYDPQVETGADKETRKLAERLEGLLTGRKTYSEDTRALRRIRQSARYQVGQYQASRFLPGGPDAEEDALIAFYQNLETVLDKQLHLHKQLDNMTDQMQAALAAGDIATANGLSNNIEIKKKQIAESDLELTRLQKKEKELKLAEARAYGRDSLNDKDMMAFKGSRYQSGGPVTVPGSGTGDIVPAMLPPGSFVLNRNASMFFQNGGAIPAMLEPGEKVFGPGSWGGGMEMLNSIIPRFQSGGIVPATHPDTGGGYQPAGAVDSHGRPVVLSKEAATQFAKMMADSGGQVKGSDVTSSTRSASKNAAVGGVPNSKHLSGNALDIHGTSQAWMRQHGAKYGFHIVDYPGSHGGHFKFVGSGGAVSAAAGVINAPANALNNMGTGLLQGLSGLGEWGSALSYFFTEAMGIFGLDQMAGAIMPALSGGLGNLIPGAESGVTPGAAAPMNITGGTSASAKKMYEYVKSKGYSSAQAKGIIANIYRESGFRTNAVGDGGMSHGMFQWYDGRSARMRAAVPNWSSNWKGQIDYALNEHVGPRYKNATAGMSAEEAAYWWMKNWEIPADRKRGGPNDMKQRSFIAGLGFQKGGVVSMSGASNDARFKKAQSEFAQTIGQAAAPIVVPVPVGGGGGPKPSISGGGTRKPPELPDGPSSLQAAEYLYRLNMGMAF